MHETAGAGKTDDVWLAAELAVDHWPNPTESTPARSRAGSKCGVGAREM